MSYKKVLNLLDLVKKSNKDTCEVMIELTSNKKYFESNGV